MLAEARAPEQPPLDYINAMLFFYKWKTRINDSKNIKLYLFRIIHAMKSAAVQHNAKLVSRKKVLIEQVESPVDNNATLYY